MNILYFFLNHKRGGEWHSTKLDIVMTHLRLKYTCYYLYTE